MASSPSSAGARTAGTTRMPNRSAGCCSSPFTPALDLRPCRATFPGAPLAAGASTCRGAGFARMRLPTTPRAPGVSCTAPCALRPTVLHPRPRLPLCSWPRPRRLAVSVGPPLVPTPRGRSRSGLLSGAARVGFACAILVSSTSFTRPPRASAGVSTSPTASGAVGPRPFGPALARGTMGVSAARSTRTSARGRVSPGCGGCTTGAVGGAPLECTGRGVGWQWWCVDG